MGTLWWLQGLRVPLSTPGFTLHWVPRCSDISRADCFDRPLRAAGPASCWAWPSRWLMWLLPPPWRAPAGQPCRWAVLLHVGFSAFSRVFMYVCMRLFVAQCLSSVQPCPVAGWSAACLPASAGQPAQGALQPHKLRAIAPAGETPHINCTCPPLGAPLVAAFSLSGCLLLTFGLASSFARCRRCSEPTAAMRGGTRVAGFGARCSIAPATSAAWCEGRQAGSLLL